MGAADCRASWSIMRNGCARLATFKRIRSVKFCDLPKTIFRNVRRLDWRQLEAERCMQGLRRDLEGSKRISHNDD
jgi:hypothetical protein